jgi:YfiH family protein
MTSYTNDSMQILFGQKTESALSKDLLKHSPQSILSELPFPIEALNFPLKSLFFQKQTHSAIGRSINQEDRAKDRVAGDREGDYLITNKSQVGLGIFTADCLPIVFFDSVEKAIGIAHAGWRGSVAKIAEACVNDLIRTFKCMPENISVWFGPSARSCCYEIDQPFIANLIDDPLAKQSIIYRDDSSFFDIPLYNKLVLEKIGIPPSQLNFSYNICTLCSQDYCSYRKEPKVYLRNITVISLK